MDDETRQQIHLSEPNFQMPTYEHVRSQSNYSIESTVQIHSPVTPTSIETATGTDTIASSVVDIRMPKSSGVGPSDFLLPVGSFSAPPPMTLPSSLQIKNDQEHFPDGGMDEDDSLVTRIQEKNMYYEIDQDVHEDSYKDNMKRMNELFRSRSASITDPVSESGENKDDSLSSLEKSKSEPPPEPSVRFTPPLEYLLHNHETDDELSELSEYMIYDHNSENGIYQLQHVQYEDHPDADDSDADETEITDDLALTLMLTLTVESDDPDKRDKSHPSDVLDVDVAEISKTSCTADTSCASDTDSVGTCESESLGSSELSHTTDTTTDTLFTYSSHESDKLDKLNVVDASDESAAESDESGEPGSETSDTEGTEDTGDTEFEDPEYPKDPEDPGHPEYSENTADVAEIADIKDTSDIEDQLSVAGVSNLDNYDDPDVPQVAAIADAAADIPHMPDISDTSDTSDVSELSKVLDEPETTDASTSRDSSRVSHPSDGSPSSDVSLVSDLEEASGDSYTSDTPEEVDESSTIDTIGADNACAHDFEYSDDTEHSSEPDESDTPDVACVADLPDVADVPDVEDESEYDGDTDNADGGDKYDFDTDNASDGENIDDGQQEFPFCEEFEEYLEYHAYICEDERQGGEKRPPDGLEHFHVQPRQAQPLTESRVVTQRLRSYQDKNYKIYAWIPVMCSMFLMLALCGFDDELVAKNADMVITIIIMCSKMGWAILFIPAVLTTKKLRYFRTLECKFDNFADVSVPYGVREFPKRAVISVSSMLHLKGTFWQKVSCVDSIVAVVLTALAILTKWDRFDTIPGGKSAALLSYLGHYGFFTAAIWERNNKNKLHLSLHYLGCIMMILGPVAFGMINEFSRASVSLGVVSVVFIILWLLCSSCLPMKSEDPVTVHRVSLICITCQLVCISTVAVSLCAYLVMLHLY